ncbi:MAG: hypothetical protein ABIO70_26740 [Pseudomonadota bacterium]
MTNLLTSIPWPLVVAVPLAWLLARSEPWNEDGWRSRPDLALLVGSGLAGGALLAWVFGPRFSPLYPLTASDFDQYCELVGAYAQLGEATFDSPRSRLAALLATQAARWLGIVPALALLSLGSVVALAAGVFLWARSLHGRTAGLLAVLLLGAVAPVGVLARDVSFYPFIVACSVWAAAGVAATFRFRGALPALVAGVALGLLLVADVRGVLWALALLPLALLGAVLAAEHRGQALLRVLVLLAPLVLSWGAATQLVPDRTPSVAQQSYNYVREGVEQAGAGPTWTENTAVGGQVPLGFVWGQTGPRELVTTLRFLRELNASVPARVSRWVHRPREAGDQVGPWLPILVVSLLVGLGGGLRKRRRMLALAGTVAPFLAVFYNAANILPQARFLSTSMVALPLVMAVGLATLVEAPVQLGPGLSLRRRLPNRALLAVAIAALALAGLPPNWLALGASWRENRVGQGEPADTIRVLEQGGIGRTSRCTLMLRNDLQQRRSLRTRLYAYPEEP